MAFKVVSRLLSLAQKETRSDSIQGRARFVEDFGPQNDDEGDEAKAKHHRLEHRVLFHGNTDDHFRLGIKLTRSACFSSVAAYNFSTSDDFRREAGQGNGSMLSSASLSISKAMSTLPIMLLIKIASPLACSQDAAQILLGITQKGYLICWMDFASEVQMCLIT